MYQSPLTFEALQVLDAIDSRGSFAAAAEQLNKVPSALSYIVQKLEEQLGVTLFVRQGRRSVLTPAGQHLLSEGRKLLSAASMVTEQTQTIAHGWEPRLRIAFDSIIDTKALMAVIAGFLNEHPNIEIDLTEQVMGGSWEALIEDRVDLLIGAPGPVPRHQGIRAQSIGEISQILVAGTRHLIASKSAVTEVDLASCRTVVVHDSATNQVPRTSNIIEQSRHIYVTTVAQKLSAITAGIGIGYLPKRRIAEELKSGNLIELNLAQTESKEASKHRAQVSTELFLALKIVNKGKGLAKLKETLFNAYTTA